MKFSTIITSLLCVNVTGVHSSTAPLRHWARKRDGQRHSNPPLSSDGSALKGFFMDGANIVYNQNWAGAVLIGSNYTSVTANVIIPNAQAPTKKTSGSYATTTWVGIDGAACSTTALLQAGVDSYVDNGRVRYEAWYEWYPKPSTPFSNFAIKMGDVINMTVTATSATSGIATLQNLSTGKSVTHKFAGERTLCMTSAEWIVEDFSSGDAMVAFANFTTVTFTNASATRNGKTVDTTGSQIFAISQSNNILSNCSTPDTSTVTCIYV